MSKTSGIWHFDKMALKRNYFFFLNTQITINQKCTITTWLRVLLWWVSLNQWGEGEQVSIFCLQPPSRSHHSPDPLDFKKPTFDSQEWVWHHPTIHVRSQAHQHDEDIPKAKDIS